MTQVLSPCFFPMENVIQDYIWGSRTSISKLLGINNPENKPQAEIWMGAHANGCSKIINNGNTQLLSDFIAQDKDAILTPKTNAQFAELPYLFKVLAAGEALSVQVHPSKAQAEAGFAKEEAAGISRNAGNRNYKDPNHKPELVYALTPYQAMNGFREFEQTIELFKKINVAAIGDLVDAFSSSLDSAGLETFFSALLSLKGEVKECAVNELLEYANENKEDPLFALILELSLQHPGDIGLFTPLMLNVITLQPGEAMFLYACTPHAYLKGTGLEIMANSDNVLRAGLTPKYMDVEELVACTKFDAIPFDSLQFTPELKEGGEYYAIPVEDFKFALFESITDLSLTVDSAEILLALDNDVTLTHESGETVVINKGQSVFIPAYTKQYQLTSSGRVARAFN
ncbi:mannose-6-phosphate isomerase, class I [Psychromonas sp. SR45-3]|uniref:mannose-6-phosphate isomerase, class I n=1 Tax=Psychromonas sp. SR45-3 TaxID=2760930 RepID=UPI001C723ACE|nr:mannose-6-phosphate isomerase, class I [Psychromonas sp. SR45-3]